MIIMGLTVHLWLGQPLDFSVLCMIIYIITLTLSVTNRCNFTTKLIRPYLDK